MMQMWWVSQNLPYPPHNQLVFMPSFGIYTEFEEGPNLAIYAFKSGDSRVLTFLISIFIFS